MGRRATTPAARYGALMMNPDQVVAPKDFVPSIEHFRIERLDGDLPPARTAAMRPATERVWVQFNRAFTLKVVSRWLAATSLRQEALPDFASVAVYMVCDVAQRG